MTVESTSGDELEEKGGPTPDRSLRGAAVAGMFARGVTVVGSLLVTPLAAAELPLAGFQSALVLLTLTVFAQLGDLGVGLALLTMYPAATGETERRQILRAAYLMSAVSALVIAGLGLLVVETGWAPRFLLRTEDGTATAGCLALVAAISVAVLVNVRLRALAAMGRQVEQNVHYGGAYVASYLVSALLLVTTHSPTWYVASAAVLPQLLIFVSTSARLMRLSPLAGVRLERGLMTTIASHAGALSLQVIALLLAVQSDVAITSRMLGSATASELALANKVISPYVLGIAIACAPLWPVFAREMRHGRVEWVRARVRRSTVLAVAGALAFAPVLILLGPTAIHLLAAGQVQVSGQYWWAGSLWCLALAVHYPLSMFVNALGVRRTQAWTAVAMLVLNLGGTISLLPVLGGPAAIWSSAVSYFVCMCLPNFFVYRRAMHTMRAVPAVGADTRQIEGAP